MPLFSNIYNQFTQPAPGFNPVAGGGMSMPQVMPSAPMVKPPLHPHDLVTHTALPPTAVPAPQGNIMQSIMQAFGNGGGMAAPGQGFDTTRLMAMLGRQ